jgi:hypothetical protein
MKVVGWIHGYQKKENRIMGFNKRFIKKEMIIRNINDLSYISKLVNADALIIDDWSDKFYKNFDFDYKNYNQLRKDIISDTEIFSDNKVILDHSNFTKLKKLSNVYVNLKTNPSWVDIQLANSILEEVIPDDVSGKFDLLVDFFIEKIDNS